jgi:hypothetical protein
MALHEIVYMSLACEAMSPEQLAGLLDGARTHNEAAGITGLLIYHEREFMQLLEGERSVIEALYDKIAVDPRHQQVYRLWDAPIATRNFNDWTMGFVSVDDSSLQRHTGFASLKDEGLVALSRDNRGKKILLGLRDELLT